MPIYRTTINMAIGKRYEEVDLPDTPETLIMVRSGLLIPVEPEPDKEKPHGLLW